MNEDRESMREGGLRFQGITKKGTEHHPLISIITVVFNGVAYLETAIKSVLYQDYPNIEYLVIDGHSNDGTLNLIKDYNDSIDYWVTEPDEGIYDAMNKGIRLANGDVIGFLNSDDVLHPGVISRIVACMGENPSEKYTCGSIDLIDLDGAIFGRSAPFAPCKRAVRRYIEMPCPHLSVYVGRKVYQEVGLFDTTFKLRADYDLLLRFLEHGAECVELPFSIGGFRSSGRSASSKVLHETKRVLRKNNVDFWMVEFVFLRLFLRYYIFKMMSKKLIVFIKKVIKSKNTYYT
jgi:glycosyltransferase involved in cell wall biosynthesis